jgi:hypothetical protein
MDAAMAAVHVALILLDRKLAERLEKATVGPDIIGNKGIDFLPCHGSIPSTATPCNDPEPLR